MASKNRVVVVGGGGHGSVVMDAVQCSDNLLLVGYVDRAPTTSAAKIGATWLGDDKVVHDLASGGDGFILGVGTVRSGGVREGIVERLTVEGCVWLSVQHPKAHLARTAAVESGTFVAARAVIQPGVLIGAHSIINTGVILEHDVTVGEYSVISPGAVVGGGCAIGRGAFIGLGANIRDHVSIGAGATVGMGAVVVSDVPPGITVVGCPARPLRH